MSTEMQNPASPNLNNPNSNSNSSQHASNYPSPTTATAPPFPIHHAAVFKGSQHRRTHSDLDYRIPDDEMGFSGRPYNGSSSASVEEAGSVDELFATYIDVEKLGETEGSGSGNSAERNGCSGGGGEGEKNMSRHMKHGNSVDGLSKRGQGAFGEIRESRKAIPPEQLAQLWSVDPKRAKRILANRQSAARSKERKARYIVELERKVQTLQEEATTLTAQLTLFQRDTAGLTTENTELKLRLQAMEHQARFRDALNEALKQEVERLKIATGELVAPSESLNLGMHMQYSPSASPSTLFSLPQQPAPVLSQLLPFHSDQQHVVLPHHLHPEHSQTLEILQNDPLSCLQGLDISNRGSQVAETEGSSLSASESSSTTS
ncbi:transcription factor RF2b-like [Cornus florida]|uniref:transcription factor RF2b-like n=1 Tax=Cornus florida TaxID=4283 RepID=UPI00289FACFA|nr:transcription factor RF2b-like [Cornus florida]